MAKTRWWWKPAKEHPRAALFAVWTILLYILAVTQDPYLRDWLWNLPGFGLLLLVIAVVITLSLGIEILKELKWSWLTIGIFVLLTIAVMDPILFRQVPAEFKEKFGSSCYSKPPDAAEPLRSTWENPGGCDLAWTLAKGGLRIYFPGGNREVYAGQTIEMRTAVTYTRVEPIGDTEWYHMTCDKSRWIPGTWSCR